MSEARDLTLKTADPAARQLHDFAEQKVKAFMKHLEEEDARRKKEQASEQEKRLVAVMSRLFSNMAIFGGSSSRVVVNPDDEKVKPVVTRTRQQSSGKRNEGDKKPKIVFDFDDFDMLDEPYKIEADAMKVVFNRNSKVIKSLSQDEKDMVRNAVLWDIAANAVTQIVVAQEVKVHEEKEGPVSIQQVMELNYRTWGKVKNEMSAIYADFLDRDPTA